MARIKQKRSAEENVYTKGRWNGRSKYKNNFTWR